MTHRPSYQTEVDLNLFPLEVVQVAAYTLLPRMEFDLAEPSQDRMVISIWPMEGQDLSREAAIELFNRELTAALFQRQAHRDYREVRHLFAIAAHELEVPEEALVQALQNLIGPLPTPEPQQITRGRTLIRRRYPIPGGYQYHLSPACDTVAAIRALSRLHDTATAVLLGFDHEGGLVFTLSPRTDTSTAWVEEQLAVLLTQCGEGGLPALYPPVHSLQRSYIQQN